VRNLDVNKLLSKLVPKLLPTKHALMVAVLGLGAALSVSSYALTDKQKKEVEQRVKPAGSVCLEGDSSCGGAVAAAGGAPKSGQQVYDATCNMCHGAGVGGAPKFGDKAAWKDRVAKGADTLHTHALAGFNAMPPKGTCAACSDDEIKAAVDYMVAKSK
jgi:cytochrome c5